MLSRKLLENNEITKLIYALKNSVLLKEATYFCKLTDRLKVDNIDRFIKLADMNGTYFWTIGLNKIKKISSGVETRFYGIPIKAYKDVLLMHIKMLMMRMECGLRGCFTKDIGRQI